MTAAMLLALLPAQAGAPPAPNADNAALAKKALAVARAEAESWKIAVGERPAEMGKDMLLEWSNPAAGKIYGGLFLWTQEGLPVAAGAFYRFLDPHNHVGTELMALSETPPQGDGGPDRTAWRPDAGLKREPLADAPKPAATAVGRLTQMRLLAKEFQLEQTPRNTAQKVVLRLLPQPIQRYGNAAKGVTDGAAFAFVNGTDPEVLLLLEAAGEPAAWRFACIRVNNIAQVATRKGKTAWSCPEIAFNEAFDRTKPYWLHTRNPKPDE